MFQSFFRQRHTEPSLIPRVDVDKALRRYCTPPPPDEKTGIQPPISDGTFHHIASLLGHLEKHLNVKGYKDVPRTYTVLYNIGREDLLPEFINRHLADVAFPYTIEKLPDIIQDDSTRSRFLKAQKYVLTDATQLELGPEGCHASTKNGDDLFHVLKHLGSGGHGSVDEVWSRLSFKCYARKRFLRKKNPRDDQLVLKMFEREVSSLKRLSHHHLVKVIGSYTDQKCVAFLMDPVADCNLMVYLSQPRTFINSRLASIRSYFGCLANAVAYLHRQQIRHRDLKPQNILVRHHDIFITDFGAALDWSKMKRDTTEDSNTPVTERYMAPEVAKRSPPNSASDMWSLGIVFIEMATVLRGRTINDMNRYLENNGSRHPYIWGNPGGTHGWFEELRRVNVSADNEAIEWVKDLTQPNPQNRPQASALTKQIRNCMSSGFIGFCCQLDDETEDYVSQSASNAYEEFGEQFQEELNQLDFEEKPYGSFIEQSRKTNVESWIDSSAFLIPNEPYELSTPYQHNYGDPPYFVIEDEAMTFKDSEVSSEILDSKSLTNARIVDQGAGYEVIEDDSDEENSEVAGLGYEITDDSSGSETTIRPECLLGTTSQEPLYQIHAEVDKAPNKSAGILSLLSDDSLRTQSICDALEALPDDGGEPNSENALENLVILDNNEPLRSDGTLEVANSMTALSQSIQPVLQASENLSKRNVDTPLADYSNNYAENLTNITANEKAAWIKCVADRLSTQDLTDDCSTENLAKGASFMNATLTNVGPTSSKVTSPRESQTKNVCGKSQPELQQNQFTTPSSFENKKSDSQPPLQDSSSKQKPADLVTRNLNEFSKPPKESPKDEKDISMSSLEDADTKCEPKALTAENLAKVSLPPVKDSLLVVVEESTKITGGDKLHKKSKKPNISQREPEFPDKLHNKGKKVSISQGEPEISADKYMQEVWEAASSVPTSIMSSKTRELLSHFGSGLAWQDKSLHLVEKYARLGKSGALKELLRVGCNPGTIKKPRYRPLINAVQGASLGHNKCVSILLRNQADPNAYIPKTKRTPLHLAIENNNFPGYTNLIRDLLDAGADPNAIDSNGDSPLLQILYGGYEPLEKHKRDALACLLQSHLSTDVNVVPPGTQNMPLHLAIRRKDPFAVAFIMHRGANVNKPNGAGITPLMLAANSWGEKATNDHIEILKFLLKSDVNVHERGRESQMSALDIAVSSGCERAARLLITKMETSEIKIALGWAKKSVMKVSSNAHANIMRLLFESIGIDFSVPDDQCPIVTAVLNASTEDVELLLDHGADPNHREKTSRAPLLHLALTAKHQIISKLLVDRGAFVDAKDDNGNDGIECARATGQDDMVDYMQKHGKVSC